MIYITSFLQTETPATSCVNVYLGTMKKQKAKSFNNNRRYTNEDDYDDFENEHHSSSKKWYQEITPDAKEFSEVPEGTLIELKDEAKKLHDAEVAAYNIKSSKNNTNYKWMKGILSKGTVSDKLAAYTVLVQDNPVYALNTLRNMIGLVKAGKKKDCITAIDNLVELFLTELLKPNQKLKPFHQRPLSLLNKMCSGNTVTRKKILIHWYFEDQLKELYTSFVLALKAVAHDTLELYKEKAISAMYKLLEGNPEQEKNLLMHIINKLGDPSQKVASKAIYCLGQLLRKNPNMQGVVLTEVEKLLFRINVPQRAQYYGICFLSQFILNHEDSEVAKRLIEVYFSFFKACIKKGEVDSRMMSALLMGVNRAYPYAKVQLDNNSEHIQTMYRIVHIASFNVSLHALSLLYQVSDFANNVNDRFYSALYKKLMDTTLLKTTHQAMVLNLVYKALMSDPESFRIRTFIKRLLQLAIHVQPNFSCGILFLVSQVVTKKDNVDAFEFKKVCSTQFDNDDDEDEKYIDVKEEPCDEIDESSTAEEKPEENVNNETNAKGQPGWYHCATVKKENKSVINQFNPLARNPLYAGGDYCTYVELNVLKNHFHPSVSLFASQILVGETVKYTGDPLKDFALMRFLDRFVCKNPKKKEILKQGSDPLGKRKQYIPAGLRSLSLMSDNYLNEKEQNIPAEERFMYMYLQKRRKARENKEDDDSDVDSVASDEFEELLDKMGGKDPGDSDESEGELDFNEDVQEHLKTNKSKKKKKVDDESSDEDLNKEISDINDVDDEDINGEDLESDLEDLNDDDLNLGESDDDALLEDDEDLEDDDDELDDGDKDLDADDDDIFIKQPKDDKDSKKQKLKKKLKSWDSDFAPAEEFAALLEDEGASMFKPGGSNTFINKDKSAVKQIAWEDKRNHWIKGHNKRSKKRTFNQSNVKNKKFKRS